MVRGDDPEEQIRLEKISSAVAASNGSKRPPTSGL